MKVALFKKSMNTTTKGFEIALNIRRKMLQIRAWGEWDVEFSKRCDMALRDKFIELSTHAHWEILCVLVDMTGLAMQTDEALALFQKHLLSGNGGRIQKIAYIGKMEGVGQNFGKPEQSFFTSSHKAFHWLSNTRRTS